MGVIVSYDIAQYFDPDSHPSHIIFIPSPTVPSFSNLRWVRGALRFRGVS